MAETHDLLKVSAIGPIRQELEQAVAQDRQAAETAKTGAQTARQEAQTAQQGAESARTDAQSARTQAQTARDEALTAQDEAEAASGEAKAARDLAATSAIAASTAQTAGLVGFANAAAMNANLNYPAGTVAMLTDTGFYYLKTGASGAGSWVASPVITALAVQAELRSQMFTDEIPGYLFLALDPLSRYLLGVEDDGSFSPGKYKLGSIPASALAGGIGTNLLASAITNSLYRANNALAAIALAALQRIAVVCCGDSNMEYNGFGFDGGLGYALSQRFVNYASPLYGAGGSTSGQGYSSNGFTASEGTLGTGAPAELEKFALANPFKYCATAAGGSIGGTNGMGQLNGLGFDVNANLRGHLQYATWPSGGGTFRPGLRRSSSPFTLLQLGAEVNTNTGQYGTAIATVDVPAGVRDFGVEVKFRVPGQAADVGPNVFYTSQLENVDAKTGYCLNTLYAAGGHSAWDMAKYFIQDSTLEQLVNYFAQIRRLMVIEGQKPKVIFYINTLVNDQNETSFPSWGPAQVTDPDSPEAYVDNMEAIRRRLIEVWMKANWDLQELFFLIVMSHPQPNETELAPMRRLGKFRFSTWPNTSVVDLADEITVAEMIALGLYNQEVEGVNDYPHQKEIGYKECAVRIIKKVPTL